MKKMKGNKKDNLHEVDRDIIKFWREFYLADEKKRREMVSKMPFVDEADRTLAYSFFEDIVFAMNYIKR
jgi:hypothetical protein